MDCSYILVQMFRSPNHSTGLKLNHFLMRWTSRDYIRWCQVWSVSIGDLWGLVLCAIGFPRFISIESFGRTLTGILTGGIMGVWYVVFSTIVCRSSRFINKCLEFLLYTRSLCDVFCRFPSWSCAYADRVRWMSSITLFYIPVIVVFLFLSIIQ